MLALMEIFRHPSLEILLRDFIHPYIAQVMERRASSMLPQKSCLQICSEQFTGTGFSCWSPVISNQWERGQLLLRSHSSKSECSWRPWMFSDPKGRRCSGDSLHAEDDKGSLEIPFLRGKFWWLGDVCLGIPCWLSSFQRIWVHPSTCTAPVVYPFLRERNMG